MSALCRPTRVRAWRLTYSTFPTTRGFDLLTSFTPTRIIIKWKRIVANGRWGSTPLPNVDFIFIKGRFTWGPKECVCLTNFIWCSTSNPKCHVMFSKIEMNITWHLRSLFEMSHECHMPNSICHFNLWGVNRHVVFCSLPVRLHVAFEIVLVNWRAF